MEAFKMGCPEWPRLFLLPPSRAVLIFDQLGITLLQAPGLSHSLFCLLGSVWWLTPNLHCYFLQINQMALTQGPKQVKPLLFCLRVLASELRKMSHQALCKHLRRSKLGDTVFRGLIWQTGSAKWPAEGRMRCEEKVLFPVNVFPVNSKVLSSSTFFYLG